MDDKDRSEEACLKDYGDIRSEGGDCPEKFSNYRCTRGDGHKGHHVACGTISHRVKAWINRGK